MSLQLHMASMSVKHHVPAGYILEVILHMLGKGRLSEVVILGVFTLSTSIKVYKNIQLEKIYLPS